MQTKKFFRLVISCCALTTALLSMNSSATGEPDNSVHLLISVPDGKKVPRDLENQLADLDKSGLTSRVLYLMATGSKEGASFESIAIVDFIDEDAYSSWREDGGKNLSKTLKVRRADILGNDENKHNDSSDSRFVVSHYESLLPRDGYQAYTDDYIVPNMMNQRWSGVMSRWTMYLERETSGKKANAVLLMEYENAEMYEQRSAVKGAYKQVLLQHHPKWAHINNIKDEQIRRDLTETYAVQKVLN